MNWGSSSDFQHRFFDINFGLQDFSTSSLRGAVAQENEEDVQVKADDALTQYQIVERKQWEQR